jgi:hypothetical protein
VTHIAGGGGGGAVVAVDGCGGRRWLLPVSIFFFHVVFCYLCTFPLFFSGGGAVGSRWRCCCNCQWFQTVVLLLFLFLGGFLFLSLFLLFLSLMMVELLSMAMLLVFLLPNRVVVQ